MQGYAPGWQMDDDEFNPPTWKKSLGVADRPTIWKRVATAFAAVAVCIYLPFCWVVLVGSALARFDWSTRWLLWLVLPGFAPGIFLGLHPYDELEWISWAVVTFGFLVVLTWLGSLGLRRFWLALGLALLVAIPSSLLGYTLIVLN